MQPQMKEPGFDTSGGRMVKEIVLILAVLALLVLLALWVVSRLASWAVEAVPTSVDTFIGEQASKSTIDESSLCTDPGMQSFVDALTRPLLEAYGEQPYDFKFVVIENEVPNAFALPGGFVTIHSGLVKEAASGEEVAGVLAHEIAHVTHRHGVRRILRSAGIAVAVGIIFGSTDLAILADYASDLGSLAYDRDQEREADETAREVMRRAKINPRGMATFFERLKEKEGSGGVPTLLSTHPDLQERVEDSLSAPLPEGELRSLPSPKGLQCMTASQGKQPPG